MYLSARLGAISVSMVGSGLSGSAVISRLAFVWKLLSKRGRLLSGEMGRRRCPLSSCLVRFGVFISLATACRCSGR